MAHKAAFCIASDEAQAMEIINQLKLAGFANDDISALLPDKTGLKDFGYERHTKAPEGALLGGGIGGLLCAALGWLVWLGVLPIHALEPLATVGPAIAALAGAAVGTLAGGIIGVSVGLSLPEYEVRRFQGKLQGDNILISVHCENGRALRWAKHIFHGAGAGAIGTGFEATPVVPSPPTAQAV
jgi:hypothetical protein